MKIGTKSVLFGYHQFMLHPLIVARAWHKLYGRPTLKHWVAFFVHDLGYLGKPNMDGPEGESHPELGAKIMLKLFGQEWSDFSLLHSRFYSKKLGRQYSKLCVADKLAFCLYPNWLLKILFGMTNEHLEYMTLPSTRGQVGEFNNLEEFETKLKDFTFKWVMAHKDGGIDTWTEKRYQ